MKQINITRDGTGKVNFQGVSVDTTENVFFTNLDQQSAHWPTLASNQLGPAPSPNSNQCVVPVPLDNTQNPPVPKSPPYTVAYGCKIEGHGSEQGEIIVFPELKAVNTTLKPATKGRPIEQQQVVAGGASPYQILFQFFQVKDAVGNVVQSDDRAQDVGPGLQLIATSNHTGVWVAGTPTVSGTYYFTFMVNDGIGKNLQQVQYSMVVA
jgi:hypothetical protein